VALLELPALSDALTDHVTGPYGGADRRAVALHVVPESNDIPTLLDPDPELQFTVAPDTPLSSVMLAVKVTVQVVDESIVVGEADADEITGGLVSAG